MKQFYLLLICLSSALFSYHEDPLTSLYNGLDPNSITQHIALYKLYPNQPIGQKAYQHAQLLLRKCHPSGDTLAHLPLVGQSIDGFVSFILGKEIQKDFLEEEYLEAIETLSSHLGNRSLKGHFVKSEKEVLELPVDQIDLARAILLTQQGDDIDWIWVRNYEAQLDFLALQVLARLQENPSYKDIIREINHVLFFDLKVRFPNRYIQDEHHKFSQLSEILDSKQGVCLGTTIIYLCLAQRLNLPLEIITPPGHIFVRLRQGDNLTNIETTHRGVHVPSDSYFSVNMKCLKQIDLKQTIACVHHNLGATYLMDHEYLKAKEHYYKALTYDPDAALFTMMLGYCYAFNSEPKEAKKTFARLKKLKFEDQIYPMDFNAQQDYLKGKISLPALMAAVLPPKKNDLEEIKKRRDLLEEEVKKHPHFCAGLHMLSMIYNDLSEPKKAIAALERIHQMDPEIPAVEFNLAMLYNENLNTPASWQHYKNCVAILKKHKVELKMMEDVKKMLLSSSIEP